MNKIFTAALLAVIVSQEAAAESTLLNVATATDEEIQDFSKQYFAPAFASCLATSAGDTPLANLAPETAQELNRLCSQEVEKQIQFLLFKDQ